MIRRPKVFLAVVLLGAAVAASAAPHAAEEEREHSMSDSMGRPTKLQFPKSGLVRVPFRRGAANHVLVEAEVGEGVVRSFVLDTGASFSVLTPNYASDQPDGEDGEGHEVAGEAIGAHGSIQGQMKFVEMQDLRIGDLTIAQAGAVSMDIPNLDEGLGEKIYGIIGFNVLSQMVTVIDYAADEVVFIDPQGDAEATMFGDPDLVVPFTLRMGALIELEGSVDGGESMPFVYDIGSPRTMLNQTASKEAEIDFDEANVENRERIRALNNDLKVEAGEAKSLSFGPLSFDKPMIYSMDLPIFKMLGLGESNAGLLGNDLFDGQRVAIDYDAKELRVWTAEPVVPAEAAESAEAP